MSKRKTIFAISVFILSGLFIYSFARPNPATENENYKIPEINEQNLDKPDVADDQKISTEKETDVTSTVENTLNQPVELELSSSDNSEHEEVKKPGEGTSVNDNDQNHPNNTENDLDLNSLEGTIEMAETFIMAKTDNHPFQKILNKLESEISQAKIIITAKNITQKKINEQEKIIIDLISEINMLEENVVELKTLEEASKFATYNGYMTELKLNGFKVGQAEKIELKLYTGKHILAKNVLTSRTKYLKNIEENDVLTSPFAPFGNLKSEKYWDSTWYRKIDSDVTRVVAEVTINGVTYKDDVELEKPLNDTPEDYI